MKNLYSVPPLTQFAISDRFIDDSYRNRSGRLKKINDYLLVRKAGNGSTSKVFEALDEKSGMTYAAKAIHIESHSSNAMNLEREIRNLRRLQNNFKSYSNCPATDKKLHNLHPTPPHNNTSSIGKTHGSINSSLSAPMMTFMNCDMKNDDNDFDTTVSNFNSTFDDHQLNIDTQQIDDDYNLVKMLEVLHCKKTHTVYLILEYAKNGSLQDLINKNVELDEDTIATIFKNILNGVRYLHSQGIVHHDIKPSNILIFENKAKLADFGIGHSFYSAENVIGSPAFQAPEFFDDSEELIDPEEEDVWSLGVTLYYSVFGKLPYVGDSVYEIVKKIKETKLEFPKEKAISKDLRDLIKFALKVNPKDRITIDEMLNHPFIAKANDTFQSRLELTFNNFNTTDNNNEGVNGSIYENRKIVQYKAEVCGKNFCFASAKRTLSWNGF